MKYAPKIFDRITFRKYSAPNESRRPINRGLFETESVVVARRDLKDLGRLAQKSDIVIEKFRLAFENDRDFVGSLLYATGRGSSTNKRTETIEGILSEALIA